MATSAFIAIPYAFSAKTVFSSWKHHNSPLAKKPLRKMATSEFEPTGRPGAGLNALQKEESLNQGQMLNLKFDVDRVAKLMYEEVLLTALFALLAIFAEHMVLPIIEDNQGSPWLISIPLSFFVFMIVIRPAEDTILQMFCSPLETHLHERIPQEEQQGEDGEQKKARHQHRLQRILQNVVLLGVILMLNLAPASLFLFESDLKVEYELKKRYEWSSSHYLRFWLSLARKYQGACAMVIMYRLYIDIAIQSSTYLTGYPSDRPLLLEEEQEREELTHSSHTPSEEKNANIGKEYTAGGIQNALGGNNNISSSKKVFLQQEFPDSDYF